MPNPATQLPRGVAATKKSCRANGKLLHKRLREHGFTTCLFVIYRTVYTDIILPKLYTKKTGMEAFEGLRFLASFGPPGTSWQEEGR